jgi:hopene-associated glycosyltransferase HpnB
MPWIFLVIVSLSVWLFLLFFWGNFWRCNQYIDDNYLTLKSFPTVWAIVPARNESAVIERSLKSLLNQQYSGNFLVVLIDDNSCDRTSDIAWQTATQLNKEKQLKIVASQPLRQNWKGKLWAMNQGIDYASEQTSQPDYFLFTDADIKHHPENLSQLVTKAETENLALVSLMVLLHCKSLWEKLLIPAFVFFFQKLYPFAWVNNPARSMAGAAGGCILISSKSLQEIGGIAAIKDALIDDCSLAQAVKSQQYKIWLGLTKNTVSLRSYDDLKTIWDTITRTAFTQLNYSVVLLIGTLIGMSIIYLAAPSGLIVGIYLHNWFLMAIAAVVWLLMVFAYIPTIKLYNLPIIWAFSLPGIAFLYTLMTLDSAIKYYQGKGGEWKGRTYD